MKSTTRGNVKKKEKKDKIQAVKHDKIFGHQPMSHPSMADWEWLIKKF